MTMLNPPERMPRIRGAQGAAGRQRGDAAEVSKLKVTEKLYREEMDNKSKNNL